MNDMGLMVDMRFDLLEPSDDCPSGMGRRRRSETSLYHLMKARTMSEVGGRVVKFNDHHLRMKTYHHCSVILPLHPVAQIFLVTRS
jgi:hypothetical protein